MGTNIHAFAHRLAALSMACLASAAIIFCALSGFGCSFIQIQALEGQGLGNINGDVFENTETAYLGVQCLSSSDSPFYDVDGSVDRLWFLSRIFLYIGLALGAATTIFAWFLGSFVRPTAVRWRVLSILAACSAVFQIPIFLVYESDTCNLDVTRQTCILSTGAYFNVVSVSIWIVMTVWVQCLRVPRWDEELDAWRVSDSRGPSTASSSDFGKGAGRELEEPYGGAVGDETVETMEVGSSPRTQEQLDSLSTPRDSNTGNNNRENQPIRKYSCAKQQPSDDHIEVTQDKFSVDPSKAGVFKLNRQSDKNEKSSFWKRDRSKEKSSRSPSRKNESPRHSLVSDLMCTSRPINVEPEITTKSYSGTIDSDKYNTVATVDKSIAADTGKHAVNASQNTDGTATSSTTNGVIPGLHMSCVYPDGTRKEAHFSSLANCCIGMGGATEEEDITKFQTRLSKDFQMVGYDDYDDRNSNSPDFLVRKLRKEEKAAAERRAKRNMAPVASFEFVRKSAPVDGNRRRNGNDGHADAVIDDDVSEMTRGSGWASGVSEILDDTDLRHQPRSILDDLAQQY